MNRALEPTLTRQQLSTTGHHISGLATFNIYLLLLAIILFLLYYATCTGKLLYTVDALSRTPAALLEEIEQFVGSTIVAALPAGPNHLRLYRQAQEVPVNKRVCPEKMA